ncbi:hypothetical protein KEM52_000114 [Ascosphaera acerosa]|nr:hypothetical protein KEM52_000114 [Ascosphaera acerosa]
MAAATAAVPVPVSLAAGHGALRPPHSPRHTTAESKMSLTQIFFLAYSARAKLSKAASQADHDLRLLVGHANMLDALMLDLNEADQAQRRAHAHQARAGQTSRHHHHDHAEEESRAARAAQSRHIQWAETVHTHGPEWDEEAISDDSCDESDVEGDEEEEDEEEEGEEQEEHALPYLDYSITHKSLTTHRVPEAYYRPSYEAPAVPQWSVSTHEVDADSDDADDYALYDEDDDDDDDYLDAVAAEAEEEELSGGLSLRRVSSHGQQAPELSPPGLELDDAEESSDDEPLLSPPQKPVTFSTTAKAHAPAAPPHSRTLAKGGSASGIAVTVQPLSSPPLVSHLQLSEDDNYFPAR